MIRFSSSLLDNRELVFIGWTVLVVLWETTAIAIVLAAFRVWTRARRPAHDYTAALVAFAAAFAIAAAVPVLLTWRAAVAASSTTLITRTAASSLALTSLNAAWLRDVLQRPVTDRFLAVAALLWAGGLLVRVVRFAGGWWLARSMTRHARPMDDPALESLIVDLARRGGVTRHVRLLESDGEAPVVIGQRNPVLLMPRTAVLRLSREQLAAVVAHEVAHIRRGDYAVNLLHSVAELPLFFSPAVAWMSRCIRDAREFCCDEEAATRIGDTRTYVEALTYLAAGTTRRMRAAVSISGPRLITRVRRLLQEDTMPRLNRLRFVTLGTALILVLFSGLQVSVASASKVRRQSDATIYKPTDPGVTQPVLVHEVKPVYTDDAKRRRVQGNVELEAVITTDGAVRDDVRVTKSLDADLDAQAVKAAKQWLFKPATKDGKPVNVRVDIEMTFTLK